MLSFSLREGEFGGVGHALGDVVISLETAKRQGSENGLTLGDEVTRLLVHGILHLAGYDHEASLLEERRMKRKEREMLRRLAEWCMQEETASQRRSMRSKRRRKVLHALGR